MSQIQKVTEVYIGNGVALDAAETNLNVIAAQIAIIGTDGKTIHLTASTIGIEPTIKIVNKNADGTFKISNPIKGTSVTSYSSAKYAPAGRNVFAIGYNRKTDTGSIDDAAGTDDLEYSFRIVFKNDKSFYSERSEALALSFTALAGADQATIAAQIANAINSSAFGSAVSGIKQVKAVVVDNGSDYGVEVTGLSINQFQNTQYQEEFVAFDIYLDNTSGFGTTSAEKIQGASRGTGTYAQAYNAENKAYGLLNRTTWPVPVQNFLASSATTLSGNVAANGNISVTSGSDIATFVTNTTNLRAGELVDVNGVAYEIKYVTADTLTVILTANASATYSGANFKVKFLYDVINISVSDITVQDGSGVGQVSSKTINIFTPGLAAADTTPYGANSGSAEREAIRTSLNAWMLTTPLAPAVLGA